MVQYRKEDLLIGSDNISYSFTRIGICVAFYYTSYNIVSLYQKRCANLWPLKIERGGSISYRTKLFRKPNLLKTSFTKTLLFDENERSSLYKITQTVCSEL